MKVGELIYELGFHFDTTNLKQFMGMVGELNMGSLLASTGWGMLVKGAIEGVQAITGFIDPLAKNAQEMRTFENVTGLSAQEMKKWGYAAEQLGVSSDTVKKSLSQLQDKMASIGPGSIRPDSAFIEALGKFKALGGVDLSGTKNEFQFYDQVIKNIDTVKNAVRRKEILVGFGLDETTMDIAREKEKFFSERAKYVAPDTEQIDKLKEYSSEFNKLGNQLVQFKTDIVVGLSEPFTRALKDMNALVESMNRNKTGANLVDGLKALVPTTDNTMYAAKFWADKYNDVFNVGYAAKFWADKAGGAVAQGIQNINYSAHYNMHGDPAVLKTITAESHKDAIESINRSLSVQHR